MQIPNVELGIALYRQTGGRTESHDVASGRSPQIACKSVEQQPRPADSQRSSITSTMCHIYTFYPLKMGC
jgi:hypothetical protein